MIRISQLFHVVVTLVILYSIIIAVIFFSFEANLAPFVIAFSEELLAIKHDIQTMIKSNICMYSISVLVLDNKTSEVVSDALVEFKVPLSNTISNRTDLKGNTVVSFTMEKWLQQETCAEALFSQGYSIEASKIGYAGYGFGTIS